MRVGVGLEPKELHELVESVVDLVVEDPEELHLCCGSVEEDFGSLLSQVNHEKEGQGDLL